MPKNTAPRNGRRLVDGYDRQGRQALPEERAQVLEYLKTI
jgi:hypothetical protein